MSDTSNLRLTFFKDENDVDFAELKIIGDPNSIVYDAKKHAEQLKADFPKEWASYFKDSKIIQKKETDLNVLKTMNPRKIEALKLEGITSVEQLSNLSDGACHGLGKGTLDYRKEAKEFLMEKHDIKPLQVVGS